MPPRAIERLYSSHHPLARLLAPAVRSLGSARRFVRNPQQRSEMLTRLFHPSAHLQGATYTEPDRYPELFAACRDHLRDLPVPRILSFGCSTGEEVFALARYLPHAHIIGVDLNPWCLKQARLANTTGSSATFLAPKSREFALTAPFDAIFCMAVLQRSENRTQGRTSAHPDFPFRRFEEQLQTLDQKLKPGGLLFLDQADFSLVDTTLAGSYRAVEFPGNCVRRQRPLFGANNQLRCTEYLADRCFLKVGIANNAHPQARISLGHGNSRPQDKPHR